MPFECAPDSHKSQSPPSRHLSHTSMPIPIDHSVALFPATVPKGVVARYDEYRNTERTTASTNEVYAVDGCSSLKYTKG